MLSYDQGDFKRTKITLTNANIEPPYLRSVRKDHKVVPPHTASFGPPSRPIGNGNKAQATQLSCILSNICQKAVDCFKSHVECMSTEDMLAAIDEINLSHSNGHKQVMVSLNAVTLYPSLKAEETANICASMIVKSGLYFEAID